MERRVTTYPMSEFHDLLQFVETTTYDDVPEDEVRRAREAILDYLGVALLGSQQASGEIVASYVKSVYADGEATVLANGNASAPGAALANGTFGSAIYFGDTFESIVIHPTAPVFPAALALAEEVDASGRDLLTAYVLGVEVTYRLGHATYPSHYDNGWHATGTIGSFGATAAAASVLDLDFETMCHAMGDVASCSSSLLKNGGTMTKGFHSGHAASVGVRAALLAADGFTADPSILDGDRGYGTVMTPGGEYDASILTDELGSTWATADIGIKPYPSARITHGPMEAMKRLRDEHGLTVDDVASVTVVLQEAFAEIVNDEVAVTEADAPYSIPHCLSTVLRESQIGLAEFQEAYLRELPDGATIEDVQIEFRPEVFGNGFGEFGTIVEVTTTDGETLRAEVEFPPGSPNNPLSEAELRQKFTNCTSSVLASDRSRKLLQAGDELEDQADLEALVSLL